MPQVLVGPMPCALQRHSVWPTEVSESHLAELTSFNALRVFRRRKESQLYSGWWCD